MGILISLDLVKGCHLYVVAFPPVLVWDMKVIVKFEYRVDNHSLVGVVGYLTAWN